MKKTGHLCRRAGTLQIRPLDASDFKRWQNFYLTLSDAQNLWDLKRKTKNELSRAAFKKVLSEQKRLRTLDRFYDLGVFQKKEDRLVGTVSLMDLCRGLSQTAYLGYSIHNNFWGQGFGKTAVSALIDIAFRDLKLHRVEAGIEAYNRRSIFLVKSLGLRKEGLKKRIVFLRGEWQDLTMYSATCEEFGFRWKNIPQKRLR